MKKGRSRYFVSGSPRREEEKKGLGMSQGIYSSPIFLQNDKELNFSQEHFFKFILVRNPMERLVSCYYDKMVTNTHKSLTAFRRNVKLQAARIRRNRKTKIARVKGVYAPVGEYNYNQDEVDDYERTLGSYPKSNAWSGFKKKNKKTRIRRRRSASDGVKDIEMSKTTAFVSTLHNNSSKTTRKNDMNKANIRNTSQMPIVIPSLDDFLEYILSTDLSGGLYSYNHVFIRDACL